VIKLLATRKIGDDQQCDARDDSALCECLSQWSVHDCECQLKRNKCKAVQWLKDSCRMSAVQISQLQGDESLIDSNKHATLATVIKHQRHWLSLCWVHSCVARMNHIDSLTQMRVRLTHVATQVSPASLERIRQAWAGVPMHRNPGRPNKHFSCVTHLFIILNCTFQPVMQHLAKFSMFWHHTQVWGFSSRKCVSSVFSHCLSMRHWLKDAIALS
jgi:hypothetical protein